MNNTVLVNGSMGTVTHTDNDYVLVNFDREGELCISLTTRDKNYKYARKFMPLIVAFAITIHKAQGLTFPKVVVFGEKFFEVGQGMTAISRTRYLKDAHFVGMDMGTALVDDDCKMYQLGESAPAKEVVEDDGDDDFLY
jgi:ATP-dependent DNA helicase PIF1